jgi:hypothetical protein
VQFRSSKKSVASVSKTGIIRAKKAGTEKITAAVRMGTSGSKQRKKTVWMKVRVVKPQNPSATDRPANTAVPTDTPSLDSGRILIAYFTRSGNAETLSYLPSGKCKKPWGNKRGNGSHYYTRGYICRLAEGLGGFSSGKGCMERNRMKQVQLFYKIYFERIGGKIL